jgi:fructokinase
MTKLIVGLGEVLWDILPSGKHLGGAPANFAYITSLLGNRGVVASCVGKDELGDEALAQLQMLGLDTATVQRNPSHATGVVKAEVDGNGCPRFDIEQPSAWDFLEWNLEFEELARSADAVCYGSLAQRSAQSRATIRHFLEATRSDVIRVFDVNLRAPFYSAEVVRESMKLAHVVKLTDEEVPKVMEMLGFKHGDEKSSAEQLISCFDLALVCVTRGSRGSLLVNGSGFHEQPGIPVNVVDTVGAGDAFAAALIHHYLRGASLARMNREASRVGAWVASQAGPTPKPVTGDLESSLAEIG